MSAVTGKKLDPVKCGLCEFSSKRITAVEKHIVDIHNITAKTLYDSIHGSTICPCGCKQETTFINWKVGYNAVVCGHNASIYAVYDEKTAAALALTRGSNWRGKASWSKGLTKETDERVKSRGEATSVGRKQAFKNGDIDIWSKGLTKETDERVASMAKNLSDGFAVGEYVPWAKGKTKDTDETVARMSVRNSFTHSQKNLRDRLDALKRFSFQEIKSKVEANGTFTIVSDLSDYRSDKEENIHVKCNTCGTVVCGNLRRLKRNRCFKCDPMGSAAQIEISNFVKSMFPLTVTNHRKTIKGADDKHFAELDIFVPEKEFAIEYNGLFWHSETFKSSTYHDNKSVQCKKANITLMHVFEDEWRDKREIVKSMIKHRLGVTSNKINARNCKIIELTSKQRKEFFNSNHIDGDVAASVAWGLLFDNEIVYALSLRSPFHKTEGSLEVARCCSNINTSLRGGLGKLTKTALDYASRQGKKKLMTYVDTRLGNGLSYSSAGWIKTGETVPRFWWTDNHDRFNRFKYKADKSKNLTEVDIANEAGVIKVWGCKNLKFEVVC